MSKTEIQYSSDKINDIRKDKILAQAKKICSSNEFSSKKKLCKLFNFIIDKAIDGDEGSLKGYFIGLEIFNRPKDFRPEDDPIVRIQVGRLRRSLELYYLKEGTNNEIRIIIPKGANIPFFIPLKLEESGNQINVSSHPTPSLPKLTTIAVLPFKNLTGDSEKNYFAVGFTEEFLIELTHYEDFQIIAPIFDSDKQNNISNSKNILETVRAHFVIEGSVRMKNEKVKISIKLIDTYTQEHIWGEQYQRDLSSHDLVDLQESICQQVIAVLAGEYGIIPQNLSKESKTRELVDIETYDAILRFYYYGARITAETAKDAFIALEQTIIKDPTCGIASSMLASLIGNTYLVDQPSSDNAIERMIDLAKKGVEFEPNNQLVRIIYAWTYFVLNKKDKFLLEMEKALQLNPNSPLRIGAIGFYLSLYGEWEKGKNLLDKAMKYNLGFPNWYYGATTLYYYRLHDYERAYEEAFKYDVPGLFWGPLLRASCLGQLKNNDAAKKELNDLLALRHDFHTRGKYLINRYVKEKELADHIFEGLQKTGLKV